jgi:hypothetical protein
MSDERKNGLTESQLASRDDLFRLLTEEIRDIVEGERLTGWTPWVVLASLISGGWVLIQEFWTASYSREIVSCVFVLLTVAVMLAVSLRKLIDEQTVDTQGRGVFSFLHSRVSASHSLLMFIWSITIAVLCLRVAHLNSRILLAASVYYFVAR